MSIAASTVRYLRENCLVLSTAESCTAGKIITLLSEVEGSGEFIESGYVVYSPQAKRRLLHVSPPLSRHSILQASKSPARWRMARYVTVLPMSP